VRTCGTGRGAATDSCERHNESSGDFVTAGFLREIQLNEFNNINAFNKYSLHMHSLSA